MFGAVAVDNAAFVYQFADVFNGHTFHEFLLTVVQRHAPHKILACTEKTPNAGTCAPRGDFGDACTTDDPTSDNLLDHDCKLGMYCPAGTCEYPPAETCL